MKKYPIGIQEYWKHLEETVKFVLSVTVYFQTYLGKILPKRIT